MILMLPMHYAAKLYGEEVSKRSRKYLGKSIKYFDRTPMSSVEQYVGVGVSMLVTGAVHVPHILMGGAPYMVAVNLASKAAKASEVVELYNLSKWTKFHWSLNPVNLASYWFLGEGLPTKQQAKAAAKTVRFASRAVPIIGAVALAFDLYDIVFNRSFWGIKFGNPTPGIKWWE